MKLIMIMGLISVSCENTETKRRIRKIKRLRCKKTGKTADLAKLFQKRWIISDTDFLSTPVPALSGISNSQHHQAAATTLAAMLLHISLRETH